MVLMRHLIVVDMCKKFCVITSKHKHKTKRTPPLQLPPYHHHNYHHHHHRNNCYRRIIGTKGALRIPTTYDNHPSIPYIDPIPSIQPTYIIVRLGRPKKNFFFISPPPMWNFLWSPYEHVPKYVSYGGAPGLRLSHDSNADDKNEVIERSH